MSDNFHFDLTGVSLPLCLQVAFAGRRKATGWAEVPIPTEAEGSPAKIWGAGRGTPKRLVFYWVAAEGVTPFPVPMTAEGVEPIVRAWLETAQYGPEPDHDGDNDKGFRVYNEAWGHVGGMYQAFVAIEPIWLMAGK